MKIKVCPRCGSDNIEWIIPQNWSMWSCYNCNYTGPIIEVDKSVQEKIEHEWKYHKEDVLKRFANTDNESEDDLSDDELNEKLDELYDK
ncbi:hypothetical protein [Methanosphaera sp. WGK6]|uniref:hypothetical protein n=1 Tax=Methanosphaera sp. WGK6 TaxID=1561964 RepID=UPI00084C69C3|nr:hypothetical protein [Methanosphaera sp. WGK6]OED30354.1 hypothetical protein NL43_02970 [Methanosphaera sp. WGK6]